MTTTETKYCKYCEKTKLVTDFDIARGNIGGRCHKCKQCRYESESPYKKLNSEEDEESKFFKHDPYYRF